MFSAKALPLATYLKYYGLLVDPILEMEGLHTAEDVVDAISPDIFQHLIDTILYGESKLVGPFTVGKQGATDLTSFLAELNARLPPQVRSNMGKNGALVNRTGRFSESARATSISPGVVTYTYMLRPYSVFEKNRLRDPRPLIEKSIQQILIAKTQQYFKGIRI